MAVRLLLAATARIVRYVRWASNRESETGRDIKTEREQLARYDEWLLDVEMSTEREAYIRAATLAGLLLLDGEMNGEWAL